MQEEHIHRPITATQSESATLHQALEREQLERRGFLTLLLALLASVWGGPILAKLLHDAYDHKTLHTESLRSLPGIPDEVKIQLIALEQRYGIQLEISTDQRYYILSNIGYTFDTEIPSSLLKTAIPLIFQTVMRYPGHYFREYGVSTFTLVYNLRKQHGTRKLKGAYIYSWLDSEMLIDVEHALDTDTFMKTIHHEIAHMIERTTDGYEAANEPWVSIHTQRAFEELEPFHQDRRHTFTDTSPYVTAYGSTDPKEERAELVGILMVPTLHRAFLARIAQLDPVEDAVSRKILHSKYEHMMQQLFIWSNGHFDDTFWSDLLAETSTAN